MPIYVTFGFVIFVVCAILIYFRSLKIQKLLEQEEKIAREKRAKYISPIRCFVLNNTILDAVNEARKYNGRIELDYDTAEQISNWRKTQTETQLIESAPGNNIERIESPFDFLVSYQPSLEDGNSQETLLNIIMKENKS